jgi:hypothetical protein
LVDIACAVANGGDKQRRPFGGALLELADDALGNIAHRINRAEYSFPVQLVSDAQRVRANWQAASAAVIGISNARKFAPRVLDGFSRMGGRLISRAELPTFTLR